MDRATPIPPADDLTIRRADEHDFDQIVDVCGRALEWSGGGTDAQFFRWKHLESPFGPSPIWLAEADDAGTRKIVGVRALMRWRLGRSENHEGGAGAFEMARAVDTATLPSHQGRGIFTKLTTAAVNELTAEGVDGIFNTPNEKSLPGYLKMGWQQLGRVSVTVQPRSVRTLRALPASRVAASKWGEPLTAGVDPADVFSDAAAVEIAIARAARPAKGGSTGWSTQLSSDYLRWRTSFGPLACRVEPLGPSVANGFIVFRVRQRGPLRQLSLLHIVNPSGRSLRKPIRSLLRATAADLVMASATSAGLSDGLGPLPRTGPILTWRPLASPSVPSMNDLDVALGAIELF